MTGKSGLGSFVSAASQCGVSPVELKEWMFENVAASPTRWSGWMSGKEPIPQKYLFAFLKAKLEMRLPRRANQ